MSHVRCDSGITWILTMVTFFVILGIIYLLASAAFFLLLVYSEASQAQVTFSKAVKFAGLSLLWPLYFVGLGRK